MRSICLVLLAIGCTHAATQTRVPTYNNPAPKSLLPQPAALKAPEVVAPSVQAQAREGTTGQVAEAGAITGSSPSQNYLVYYYPEAGQSPYQTRGTVPQGTTPAVTPYVGNEPGFLSRIPWTDVTYVVSALVLVAAGSTLVYNVVGTQVRSRALRELKDISYDDASQMARRVLRAIDKFQNMNVEQQ